MHPRALQVASETSETDTSNVSPTYLGSFEITGDAPHLVRVSYYYQEDIGRGARVFGLVGPLGLAGDNGSMLSDCSGGGSIEGHLGRSIKSPTAALRSYLMDSE